MTQQGAEFGIMLYGLEPNSTISERPFAGQEIFSESDQASMEANIECVQEVKSRDDTYLGVTCRATVVTRITLPAARGGRPS